MNPIMTLIVTLFLIAPAFAQPGPRGDRRSGEDGPPPRGTGEFRPGGPGERGAISPLVAQVEAMRAWMEMVDRYTRLARDPASSGIAAVIGVNDLYRTRPEQAIDVFTKMLKEVKNDSVQRAIRLQLVELYTKTNQQDSALEQLKHLMVSAPPGAASVDPRGSEQ